MFQSLCLKEKYATFPNKMLENRLHQNETENQEKKQVEGRRPTHKGGLGSGRKRVRTLPKRPSVFDRGDAPRLDQCAQNRQLC